MKFGDFASRLHKLQYLLTNKFIRSLAYKRHKLCSKRIQYTNKFLEIISLVIEDTSSQSL